jgi:hypothetical protein
MSVATSGNDSVSPVERDETAGQGTQYYTQRANAAQHSAPGSKPGAIEIRTPMWTACAA